MGGEPFTDVLIARIARRQRGVVARAQLLQAGVSAREIERRQVAGRLHVVHRGVYLVGHAVGPRLAPETAALLACGWDPASAQIAAAVLSHRSAAPLWDLLSYPATAPVWVTVSPERCISRARIEIHRLPLEPQDIRTRHGLPLTSPPRTILDLAAVLDAEPLEHLIAEAQYRRLASEEELRDQLDRNRRRPGTRALRAALDVPGGPQRTRSPAERRLLRLLRASGLEGYELNARIHGYEVDVLWRRERLALEVDGWEAHRGRVAFERDRLKMATLEAHGITVMPVTPRRIRDDPEGVLARLRRALDRTRSPAHLPDDRARGA